MGVICSLALGITLAILYTVSCSPVTTIGGTSGATFSVDLIYRDSIRSPFYDNGMTLSKRVGRALQRSINNAKRFELSNSSTYQAQIIPDQEEFLMNISLGNPPRQILAIADTGSDLSWIQCSPCIQCYEHVGSLFNPKLSSTYKPVGCNSKTCELFNNNCSSTVSTCQFSLTYGDGSFSNGDVATETIKLGGRDLQDFVFGCSFRNGGIFRETWGGIIGLGGGDFSLVSQISTLVTPKFSYCLIPNPMDDRLSNLSSKLIFGDINFGSQAVSTPLVPKIPRTFYYVTLEGITVGNTRLNYSESTNPLKPMHKGNMIVDSGTTLTTLPNKLYQRVETAVKENLTNVRTIKDPSGQLSLCYRSKLVKHVPKITMHFEGADVTLLRYNTFLAVSKHVKCLAMVSSDIAIFGNVAQSNFLVGYDLEKSSLSFKRTDCTRFN